MAQVYHDIKAPGVYKKKSTEASAAKTTTAAADETASTQNEKQPAEYRITFVRPVEPGFHRCLP